MSLINRNGDQPLEDITNLLSKTCKVSPLTYYGAAFVDLEKTAKENISKIPKVSLSGPNKQVLSNINADNTNSLTAKVLEKLPPSIEEMRRQVESTKREFTEVQAALTKAHTQQNRIIVVNHAIKSLAKWNDLSSEIKAQIPRLYLELERVKTGVALLISDVEMLKKNGYALSTTDPSCARVYFEMGARKGDGEAAVCLAFLLKRGEGGPQDLKKARDYFEQGARCFEDKNLLKNKLSEIAVCELINIYEAGSGGAPNVNRAKVLYQKLIYETVITDLKVQDYILEFVIARGDQQAIIIHEKKVVDLLWNKSKALIEKCGGRFLMVAQNEPPIEKKIMQNKAAHEEFWHKLNELASIIFESELLHEKHEFEEGSCVGIVVEFSVEVEKDKEENLEQRLCNAAKKYQTRSGITALALQTLYNNLLKQLSNTPLLSLKRKVSVYSKENAQMINLIDLTDTFQEINRGKNLNTSLSFHEAETKTFKAVGKKLTSLATLANLGMMSDAEYLQKWAVECPDGEYRLGTSDHCLYLAKCNEEVFLLDPSVGLSAWPKENCAKMLVQYLDLVYGQVSHCLDIRRIDTLK